MIPVHSLTLFTFNKSEHKLVTEISTLEANCGAEHRPPGYLFNVWAPNMRFRINSARSGKTREFRLSHSVRNADNEVTHWVCGEVDVPAGERPFTVIIFND